MNMDTRPPARQANRDGTPPERLSNPLYAGVVNNEGTYTDSKRSACGSDDPSPHRRTLGSSPACSGQGSVVALYLGRVWRRANHYRY